MGFAWNWILVFVVENRFWMKTYFSSSMGGIVCKECNETLGVKLKMHHKIRDFLQAMLQFDFDYESEYDRKATEKSLSGLF